MSFTRHNRTQLPAWRLRWKSSPRSSCCNVISQLDKPSDIRALISSSRKAKDTWFANKKSALINFFAKNLSDDALVTGLKVLKKIRPANNASNPPTPTPKWILSTLKEDELFFLYKLCARYEPIVNATIWSLPSIERCRDAPKAKYSYMPHWMRDRLLPVLESGDHRSKLKSRVYRGLFYFEIFMREGCGLTNLHRPNRIDADDWAAWFGASGDQAFITQGLQDLTLALCFFWNLRGVMPPRRRQLPFTFMFDQPGMVTSLLPTALKSKGLLEKGLGRATVNDAAKL